MTYTTHILSLLRETFAICRLEADSAIPPWATGSDFFCITRTVDELSIVCRQESVPSGIRCEAGWRCLRVEGPLDFSQTGIFASLTTPLAVAGVSIFAVSTFDTDYLLVKEEVMEKTIEALSGGGHQVIH